MNDKLLNFDHVRTPEQRALMEKIRADGVCPFCKEHLKEYHPRPIIRETDFWFLTTNMNPYEGTKYHFLFIYKLSHVRFPHDIAREARIDLFDLVDSVIHEHQIPGASFFMRFGDTRYNGSSVEHLHAHLIVGDVDAPNHEPVRVKLG